MVQGGQGYIPVTGTTPSFASVAPPPCSVWPAAAPLASLRLHHSLHLRSLRHSCLQRERACTSAPARSALRREVQGTGRRVQGASAATRSALRREAAPSSSCISETSSNASEFSSRAMGSSPLSSSALVLTPLALTHSSPVTCRRRLSSPITHRRWLLTPPSLPPRVRRLQTCTVMRSHSTHRPHPRPHPLRRRSERGRSAAGSSTLDPRPSAMHRLRPLRRSERGWSAAGCTTSTARACSAMPMARRCCERPLARLSSRLCRGHHTSGPRPVGGCSRWEIAPRLTTRPRHRHSRARELMAPGLATGRSRAVQTRRGVRSLMSSCTR